MTVTTPRTRRLVALCAVPALLAGLAACSSADAADETASQETVERQAHDWDLALSQCMRDAGFEMDDPQGGGVQISLPEGGDADAYFAAFEDCQASVDDELGERPVSEAEKKAGEEAAKKWEVIQDCLEEHGVEFPDADSGVVAAPDVPDDVAAECGADGFGMSTGVTR